jgi:regulatory protein
VPGPFVTLQIVTEGAFKVGPMTLSRGGSGQFDKPGAPDSSSDSPDRNSAYLAARSAALRLLGYRGRSKAEVRRRLSPRYEPQIIDRVIAALTEQGYLDDTAFARQWRSNRERKRPRGKNLLQKELLAKGISSETAREALEDFDGLGNAYRAGQNLASRLAGEEFPKFRQRLWSLLQRRGFEGYVIRETVQTLWQELANPLDSGVDSETDEEQYEGSE